MKMEEFNIILETMAKNHSYKTINDMVTDKKLDLSNKANLLKFLNLFLDDLTTEDTGYDFQGRICYTDWHGNIVWYI